VAAAVRLMHRRHGWNLTAATSLAVFGLSYGCIINGNDEGATAPPWFVDLTIAAAAMIVVSMIAVVAYHVRLQRMPLAVLTEAKPLAARHPHGPRSHHYPPRHRLTWVIRWIGMAVILFVAVVSVPAVVDATAYLTGLEKTVTFDPTSHQTNCDRYSCETVTQGTLETGGAGTSATWQTVVPLGKPFKIREPVWRWGLGLALIDSDGTAVLAIALSLLIEGAAVLVVIQMTRLALNWRRHRQQQPAKVPASAA
jgi:hypothetical protein